MYETTDSKWWKYKYLGMEKEVLILDTLQSQKTSENVKIPQSLLFPTSLNLLLMDKLLFAVSKTSSALLERDMPVDWIRIC